MKKLFLTLFSCLCLSVYGADIQNIQYKNIKDGENIVNFENGNWGFANKKSSEYFTKKISSGTGSYSEFYSPEGEFLFSTGCQYEFIINGSMIGYSNYDLKFYEFTMNKGILEQRELSVEEVQNLFKDFKIVKISDFTTRTNSLKINKDNGKILLLNDTDRYFYHYSYTSNNTKFETYPLKGLLKIKKGGMIHFSHFGDNTKDNPWFILLVR